MQAIPYTHIKHLYINGRWEKVQGAESVINPATEVELGSAPVGDIAMASAAIQAARSAFDNGPWPNLAISERAAILKRLHSALEAKRDQIAELIIAEVGCAQGITHAMQVGAPLSHFASALGYSASDDRRYLPLEATPNPMNPTGPRILGGGSVIREPIGVVAGITGYNFPFLLNLAKIVPALLAGNTLVLKPSPFTPYSALLFGEFAEAIGLPKGVLNIVTGGNDVGSLLSSHADVDMVSFTGSEAVGITIMQQAAATLKRVHLELGGKSALIVRADADVQQAALGAVAGLSVNCGQGCALLTRFLVHNSIRQQFVEMAKAIAGQWKIGDPADPTVLMGPLIRETQRGKVRSEERRVGK